MGEFKIHHLVSELIQLLEIPEKANEGVSSDSYAELLQKNRTPYVTSKVSVLSAVNKLSENAPSAEAVLEKYNYLKTRNFREVDSLVYLLAQISLDEKVKNLLKKNFVESKSGNLKDADKKNTFIVSCAPNGHITDEVLQLTDRYQKQIASELSSNFLRDPCIKRSASLCVQQQFPQWVTDRRYLTWDFVPESKLDSCHSGPIGALPVSTQENCLIDDILFCMAGVEGEYVHVKNSDDSKNEKLFAIDDSSDPSLHEMVKRILPLLSHYSTITHFIDEKSHFGYGLVNHALSAAMRHLLKDYFILIAQLEHQHRQNTLSLQKLWFYIQPTMRTMEVMASIADIINKGDCFGGTVLTVLHDKTATLTGDSKSQELCLYLTQAACVPYFEILERWIYKGIISDPYSEFLVEDNELVKKEELPVEYSDDYWEKRYTIRREQIPIFLEKVADMILRTGKYLNVIRQCGDDIKCPDAETIVYTVRERQYVERIEAAYHFASRKLLDMLMDGADLMGRLRSVKHYFLLDQGDFIVQFMDMAEEELQKDIDDIMPTRLESLLELALRTSVVNSDKYKDDVRVELLPYDLLTQMFKILRISAEDQKEYGDISNTLLTGLEAFAFDYEVKWPLSLVINRRVLACYQMLFRHLFYCKHVERLLGNVWTLNKVAKTFSLDASCSYSSAFALRQRMLNFIQNLEYYMMFEVIEPHWHTFQSKMLEVSNVDEVLLCHNDFLESCLKDCMLTFPELLQVVVRLIKLCVTFSNFMQKTHQYAVEAELSTMGDSMLFPVTEEQGNMTKSTEQPAGLQLNYQQHISAFHTDFNSHLISLLEMISGHNHNKYSAKMVNMLYRLDFNGFYTRNPDAETGNSAVEVSVP